MNEDFNPGQASENPAGSSENGLARALEDLIQGRAALAGGQPPELPGDEGAPFEVAAGPCPQPGEWALLLGEVAGPAGKARVDALLSHAAGCRVCAERLRVLSADLSNEETDLLARLGCASADGQKDLAETLARTPRQSGAGFGSSNSAGSGRATRLYLWTGAGLAASLLIAVGLVSWWRLANNPDRLLAEAYTQSRTFDMRMQGAGFSEVTPKTHLRGGRTGRESSKLLEARANIEHHLEAAPEDAHWLQLEARSDILEEKFDPAIDILDRLVAAGPVTASLLLDDASAYYQRGAATGDENDRNTALDYLRRADEMAPDDPVVLFNEAVAMEDRAR